MFIDGTERVAITENETDKFGYVTKAGKKDIIKKIFTAFVLCIKEITAGQCIGIDIGIV